MPKPNKQHHPNEPYERNESRTSETVTVAWTLSVVTTLVCLVLAMAAHLLHWAQPESERLPVLEAFALFSARTIGLVSLLLVPAVYRIRRVPPPIGIVAFGVIVAAAPWIVLLAAKLR